MEEHTSDPNAATREAAPAATAATAPAATATESAAGAPAGSAMSGQAQQPQFIQQGPIVWQLPPGYALDPGAGRIVFVGQEAGMPQAAAAAATPGPVIMQQPVPPQIPPPDQAATTQAAAQHRYGRIVRSVEQFIEGEATVADVAKTLFTDTMQDDQLWKGMLVGAAAAVLLTSEPVREAMGKTLGGIFPGVPGGKKTAGAGAPAGNEQPAAEKE